MIGLLAIAAAAPFIGLVNAVIRASALFWPTMILLGAVHSGIPAVPALGWELTWLVVALITVLVPFASSGSDS
jgi:hypothetical protein